MVTGGFPDISDVEVLNPDGTRLCTLQPMPEGRYGQSQVGQTVIGGTFDSAINKNYIKYTAGDWGPSYPLQYSRYTSPTLNLYEEGILVMGGYYSDTAELLNDGTSTVKFTLDEPASFSCGIDLGDATVIVGGAGTLNDVRVVYPDGSQMSLPSLNEGRQVPACGHYVDDYGNENLIVVAGGNANYEFLDTTEWYDYGGNGAQWYLLESKYPYKTWWPVGFSIDNNVFSTGGQVGSDSISDIFKFNKDTLEWDFVDYMTIPRAVHATGIVNRDDVEPYCVYTDVEKNEIRRVAANISSPAGLE